MGIKIKTTIKLKLNLIKTTIITELHNNCIYKKIICIKSLHKRYRVIKIQTFLCNKYDTVNTFPLIVLTQK